MQALMPGVSVTHNVWPTGEQQSHSASFAPAEHGPLAPGARCTVQLPDKTVSHTHAAALFLVSRECLRFLAVGECSGCFETCFQWGVSVVFSVCCRWWCWPCPPADEADVVAHGAARERGDLPALEEREHDLPRTRGRRQGPVGRSRRKISRQEREQRPSTHCKPKTPLLR